MLSSFSTRLAVVLLVASLLCQGCDKSRQDRALLRKQLAQGDSVDVTALSAICARMGSEASEIVRREVRSARSAVRQVRLIQGLLDCDLHGNVAWGVDAVCEIGLGEQSLAQFLRGRVDHRAREVLQAYVTTAVDCKLVVACSIIQLVADDQWSLRFAKDRLQPGFARGSEVDALLLLLGDAAYLNDDSDAVEVAAPYLEDASHRLSALIALSRIPGDRALQLLRSFANDERLDDSLLIERLLESREEVFSKRYAAPGWPEGDAHPDTGKSPD